MSTEYENIAENFSLGLDLVESVVTNAEMSFEGGARIAVCNSVHLLLVAEFEEFIRQMAAEAASRFLTNSENSAELPRQLFKTMWNSLSQEGSEEIKENDKIKKGKYTIDMFRSFTENVVRKIDNLNEFMLGKSNSKSPVVGLIKNRNNMKCDEINFLFSLCNISNICKSVCEGDEMRNHYGPELNENEINEQFRKDIENFINGRNAVAHSIGNVTSLGVLELKKTINLFKAFAADLAEFLNEKQMLVSTAA